MGLFKTKPYLSTRAGGFQFDFYYKEGSIKDTYLEITCDSGIFVLKIGGNTHAYGYLLAAAEQGRTDQLQGYAVTINIPAMAITQDQGLCNDCQKAIMKWQKHKEKEAESAANNVSGAQNMADEQLMREAIKRSQMSRKAAKKASKADRAEMKRILKEEEDGK